MGQTFPIEEVDGAIYIPHFHVLADIETRQIVNTGIYQYVKLAHVQISMLFPSAAQLQDSATAEPLCNEPSSRRYNELCSINVRCMEGNPDITNARYDKYVYLVTVYYYQRLLAVGWRLGT